MRRRLTLSKETLAELTTEQLGDVVGGAITKPQCFSGIVGCLPTDPCYTWDACGTANGCL